MAKASTSQNYCIHTGRRRKDNYMQKHPDDRMNQIRRANRRNRFSKFLVKDVMGKKSSVCKKEMNTKELSSQIKRGHKISNNGKSDKKKETKKYLEKKSDNWSSLVRRTNRISIRKFHVREVMAKRAYKISSHQEVDFQHKQNDVKVNQIELDDKDPNIHSEYPNKTHSNEMQTHEKGSMFLIDQKRSLARSSFLFNQSKRKRISKFLVKDVLAKRCYTTKTRPSERQENISCERKQMLQEKATSQSNMLSHPNKGHHFSQRQYNYKRKLPESDSNIQLEVCNNDCSDASGVQEKTESELENSDKTDSNLSSSQKHCIYKSPIIARQTSPKQSDGAREVDLHLSDKRINNLHELRKRQQKASELLDLLRQSRLTPTFDRFPLKDSFSQRKYVCKKKLPTECLDNFQIETNTVAIDNSANTQDILFDSKGKTSEKLSSLFLRRTDRKRSPTFSIRDVMGKRKSKTDEQAVCEDSRDCIEQNVESEHTSDAIHCDAIGSKVCEVLNEHSSTNGPTVIESGCTSSLTLRRTNRMAKQKFIVSKLLAKRAYLTNKSLKKGDVNPDVSGDKKKRHFRPELSLAAQCESHKTALHINTSVDCQPGKTAKGINSQTRKRGRPQKKHYRIFGLKPKLIENGNYEDTQNGKTFRSSKPEKLDYNSKQLSNEQCISDVVVDNQKTYSCVKNQQESGNGRQTFIVQSKTQRSPRKNRDDAAIQKRKFQPTCHIVGKNSAEIQEGPEVHCHPRKRGSPPKSRIYEEFCEKQEMYSPSIMPDNHKHTTQSEMNVKEHFSRLGCRSRISGYSLSVLYDDFDTTDTSKNTTLNETDYRSEQNTGNSTESVIEALHENMLAEEESDISNSHESYVCQQENCMPDCNIEPKTCDLMEIELTDTKQVDHKHNVISYQKTHEREFSFVNQELPPEAVLSNNSFHEQGKGIVVPHSFETNGTDVEFHAGKCVRHKKRHNHEENEIYSSSSKADNHKHTPPQEANAMKKLPSVNQEVPEEAGLCNVSVHEQSKGIVVPPIRPCDSQTNNLTSTQLSVEQLSQDKNIIGHLVGCRSVETQGTHVFQPTKVGRPKKRHIHEQNEIFSLSSKSGKPKHTSPQEVNLLKNSYRSHLRERSCGKHNSTETEQIKRGRPTKSHIHELSLEQLSQDKNLIGHLVGCRSFETQGTNVFQPRKVGRPKKRHIHEENEIFSPSSKSGKPKHTSPQEVNLLKNSYRSHLRERSCGKHNSTETEQIKRGRPTKSHIHELSLEQLSQDKSIKGRLVGCGSVKTHGTKVFLPRKVGRPKKSHIHEENEIYSPYSKSGKPKHSSPREVNLLKNSYRSHLQERSCGKHNSTKTEQIKQVNPQIRKAGRPVKNLKHNEKLPGVGSNVLPRNTSGRHVIKCIPAETPPTEIRQRYQAHVQHRKPGRPRKNHVDKDETQERKESSLKQNIHDLSLAGQKEKGTLQSRKPGRPLKKIMLHGLRHRKFITSTRKLEILQKNNYGRLGNWTNIFQYNKCLRSSDNKFLRSDNNLPTKLGDGIQQEKNFSNLSHKVKQNASLRNTETKEKLNAVISERTCTDNNTTIDTYKIKQCKVYQLKPLWIRLLGIMATCTVNLVDCRPKLVCGSELSGRQSLSMGDISEDNDKLSYTSDDDSGRSIGCGCCSDGDDPDVINNPGTGGFENNDGGSSLLPSTDIGFELVNGQSRLVPGSELSVEQNLSIGYISEDIDKLVYTQDEDLGRSIGCGCCSDGEDPDRHSEKECNDGPAKATCLPTNLDAFFTDDLNTTCEIICDETVDNCMDINNYYATMKSSAPKIVDGNCISLSISDSNIDDMMVTCGVPPQFCSSETCDTLYTNTEPPTSETCISNITTPTIETITDYRTQTADSTSELCVPCDKGDKLTPIEGSVSITHNVSPSCYELRSMNGDEPSVQEETCGFQSSIVNSHMLPTHTNVQCDEKCNVNSGENDVTHDAARLPQSIIHNSSTSTEPSALVSLEDHGYALNAGNFFELCGRVCQATQVSEALLDRTIIRPLNRDNNNKDLYADENSTVCGSLDLKSIAHVVNSDLPLSDDDDHTTHHVEHVSTQTSTMDFYMSEFEECMS